MKANVLNFVRKPAVLIAISTVVGTILGSALTPSKKTDELSFDDHADSALDLVSDETSTTN